MTSDIRAAWRDQRIRFLVRFIAYAIPLWIFLLLGITIPAFQQFTADVSYDLLMGTGLTVTRNGEFFSIPVEGGTWGAFINWDCTGWKALFALSALILATSLPVRRKLLGLAVLLPVLYGLNLVRIVAMFHIVAADVSLFALAHALVWSGGMIVAVLGLWLVWLRTPSLRSMASTRASL